MHLDLAETIQERFETDVAVIGAGATGLTLARALVEGGRSVLLLESGGIDHEAASAELNRGFVEGQEYYPLEDSRLRFVGGTTAIWGGRVAELDAIDFEKRDWVPHSGWPLSADDLAPWYRAARPLLDLPAEAPSSSPSPLNRLDGSDVELRQWLIDGRFDRFGFQAQKALFAHPRLTLLTHATVREIRAARDGRSIEGLEVVALGGKTVTVVARDYVLAAGGLENPRLLLASRSVMPAGLGNERDLVGRFFMEHPHGRGGAILAPPKQTWQLISAFQKRLVQGGVETAVLVRPSDALQRRRGILNSSLTVAVRPLAGGRQPLVTAAYLAGKHRLEPTRGGRRLWQAYKTGAKLLRRSLGPLPFWLRERQRGYGLSIVLRAEQAPNPDSRVTLRPDQPDPVGVPRISLDWRFGEIDRVSAAGLVVAFGQALEKAGLGQVRPAEWLGDPTVTWLSDPLVSVHPLGGYHHMGTTRMADDPSQGVTDRDGKVHGIANLWVAGSSLFPTGGWANPTLTILALALRQADRMLARS